MYSPISAGPSAVVENESVRYDDNSMVAEEKENPIESPVDREVEADGSNSDNLDVNQYGETVAYGKDGPLLEDSPIGRTDPTNDHDIAVEANPEAEDKPLNDVALPKKNAALAPKKANGSSVTKKQIQPPPPRANSRPAIPARSDSASRNKRASPAPAASTRGRSTQRSAPHLAPPPPKPQRTGSATGTAQRAASEQKQQANARGTRAATPSSFTAAPALRPSSPAGNASSLMPTRRTRSSSSSSGVKARGQSKSRGPQPIVTLDNLESSAPVKGVLTSPRSLKVCHNENVAPAELAPRLLIDFMGPGVPLAIAEARFKAYEERRHEKLAHLQTLRRELILDDHEDAAEEEAAKLEAQEIDRRLNEINASTAKYKKQATPYGQSPAVRSSPAAKSHWQRTPTDTVHNRSARTDDREPEPRMPHIQMSARLQPPSQHRQTWSGPRTGVQSTSRFSSYNRNVGSLAARSRSTSSRQRSAGEQRLLEAALVQEERQVAAYERMNVLEEDRVQYLLAMELEKERRSCERLTELEHAKQRIISMRRSQWNNRIAEAETRKNLFEEERQCRLMESIERHNRASRIDKYSVLTAREQYKTPADRAVRRAESEHQYSHERHLRASSANYTPRSVSGRPRSPAGVRSGSNLRVQSSGGRPMRRLTAPPPPAEQEKPELEQEVDVGEEHDAADENAPMDDSTHNEQHQDDDEEEVDGDDEERSQHNEDGDENGNEEQPSQRSGDSDPEES